ncbi:transcriptional regulator [Candidatus Peregrinibacteria bacterium CG_4_10_14_0_2_um_filter_38_24]|nr:MAG: transcriptional regulator [Candidatus Peregrinibacteria bacterium CG_4_10_14_0_2_um_filter_38_24]PJC38949.1 MAG: transcriptional regulator [Candidatus Peregrinibacteria bacterium CG_4_9_14_0_2_um_filter_38_9]
MEQEDYLEEIYNLFKENGHIRISDIANSLNVKKPSVTQMMQRLKKEDCLLYEPYSPIKLTEKGYKIGKSVAERHRVLAEFFTILGISKQIQEKDIHGIEHSLSETTLKRLKEVSAFLKKKKF